MVRTGEVNGRVRREINLKIFAPILPLFLRNLLMRGANQIDIVFTRSFEIANQHDIIVDCAA